jgi:hypothetical protein
MMTAHLIKSALFFAVDSKALAEKRTALFLASRKKRGNEFPSLLCGGSRWRKTIVALSALFLASMQKRWNKFPCFRCCRNRWRKIGRPAEVEPDNHYQVKDKEKAVK